jgi:glycine oxidase
LSGARETRHYDVAVVGAGVIGLACAWRAAQRGLSVVVIERDLVGSGASGVAAGMLAPVTEADFGEQELLEANLAAARAWPALASELAAASGMDLGYRETGALVVAADRDDAAELRRLHDFQRSRGLHAEWLSGRECRRLEPGLSPRVAGGILAAGDHQVDPRAVLRALAQATRDAGGEIVERAGPARIVTSGARVTGVSLPGGMEVHASRVVLAAGAWTPLLAGLPGGAAAPVRPVKGQIISLAARPGQSVPGRIVRSPRCYLLVRDDGRVVLGATVEERGYDERPTAEGVFRLLEAAWEVFPGVLELDFVEVSAGLRPGSPGNTPLVGRGELEGLVWATGHYRNGVLLAPVTAEAVVGELLGQPKHATYEQPVAEAIR